MGFAEDYLHELTGLIGQIDAREIERLAQMLSDVRLSGGRLFVLGVGGSAANASHAVGDFRKILGLEAYAPTDNISELTARTNDEGWSSVFESWLRISRLRKEDLVLVFSVGGGSEEASPNIVKGLKFAKSVGARIAGVVGRDGGHVAKVADACVNIPTVNPTHITPHAETLQAVVWHLLVFHPGLKAPAARGGHFVE